ncbi:MAG: hypothetical protein RL748_3489 [Pseudomonadota bacterium]|jgi:hypothetical protein
MKLSKRIGPVPVEPVELHGLRIQVPHYGQEIGVEQNGGYIEAVDAITGLHLWYLMIYETKYSNGKERDGQDVFIVKIGVRDGMLRVKEGYGRVYEVDVCEKRVSLAYSPIAKEKQALREAKVGKDFYGKLPY